LIASSSSAARKTLRLATSILVISTLPVARSHAAETQVDFKDYIIATYETAMTLKRLPLAQGNLDYERLVSECRYHLYKAMSSAATSGRWDDVKHRIPRVETCSYTGSVKPETIVDYQQHWLKADNASRDVPRAQANQPPKDTATPSTIKPQSQSSSAPSDDVVVSQKQPCYMGVPCKVTVEKRRPQAPDSQSSSASSSQPPSAAQEIDASVPPIEELTATKTAIVARSPRTERPFEACEKSMRYPMEVSLIANRLKFSKEQLADYQAKMTLQARRSCVCIIQKIEPALDSKEAEDNYTVVLENLHTNTTQFKINTAVRGFDEKKLIATISSVNGVISQCPSNP